MMDEREALAPCPICGTPDPWTGSVGGQTIVVCSADSCPEADCDWVPEEWAARVRAAAALRTQAWEQGRDAAKQYCADRAMAYGSQWYTNRDQRSFMGGKAQGFIEAKNGIAALTPPDQMQRDPAAQAGGE